MASLCRLHALDCVLNATSRTVTQRGETLLAWVDCLLRAEHPSPRRIEACIAAIEAEFGIHA